MQYLDFWQLPPFGSIVGVDVDPLGFVKHVGVLVPHTMWGAAVISFARRGKIIQTVDEFSGGKGFDSVEYPSQTPAEVVVWRAQTAIITRPYHLMTFNCDYFARYCHGLILESPQAQSFTVLGLLALGIAFAATARA